jgi:hypothetical protein
MIYAKWMDLFEANDLLLASVSSSMCVSDTLPHGRAYDALCLYMWLSPNDDKQAQ